MANSNSSLNIIIRAKDLAKGTLNKVTARLRGMGKASEQTESRFASLGRSIRNLVVASLGFYTIKKSMQSVLQTGDQFERLEVQMKAIMGSIEEGDRAIEWIKEFTQNTPLELQQVADAFTALKNFGLDPMDGTLQAIVDQTSKLGGGMERLNGISLALGQAWAKQKLQGEEILQLVERGVPVWEMLEKVTGKNVQELQKLSSAGKLGRDTMKLLIQEIGSSSAGAAADNMSLLSGLMSNMADRWELFKKSIADAGWLDYVKGQLTEFGKKIDELDKNGKLQTLAKSISDGFISMAESVRLSLSQIKFENFVANIQGTFNTVSSALGGMRSAFVLTGSTVSIFFNGFTSGVKVWGGALTAQFYLITKGFQKLFEALGQDGAAERARKSSELLKSISKEFAKEVLKDTDEIHQAWDSFTDELEASNQQNQQNIRNENKQTTTEQKANLKETQNELKKTGNVAKKTFTDAADALKQINAAKTRTELADLGVVLVKSFQEGAITQEQYNEALEASNEKLKALEEQAKRAADATKNIGDAAGEASALATAGTESITGAMSGMYDGLSTELNSMSEAAENAFQNVGNTSNDAKGEIADLKSELAATNQELSDLGKGPGFDVTGISDWMNETAQRAAHIKKEFLEQKIALEELLKGYDDGIISAQAFSSAADQAANTMSLLNEQDLDRLNSAIESAKSNMDQLGESSLSTLDSLQNELDQLQGKQDEVLRRQYESRQRDLKQQLTEAQQGGNSAAVSNLNQALNVNQSIYQEKRRQETQKQQEQQRREQEQRLRENSRIKSERQATQSRNPEKMIRLEYPGGNVDVGVNSGDEAKLLEALKNAGMRSL